MTNKFPYHTIFHVSESDMSVLGSMTTDEEPTEDEVVKYMSEYEGCTFCEVYYDKYDTEEYDELLWTYTK